MSARKPVHPNIAGHHSAFTLIELTVVAALLGGLAVAFALFQPQHLLEPLEARTEAQRMVATFRMARSTAIASGQNVMVRVVPPVQAGRNQFGYRTTLEGSTSVPLQLDTYFPENLSVRWSERQIVFDPQGTCDRSLNISLASSRSTWVVDVTRANGRAVAEQLSP